MSHGDFQSDIGATAESEESGNGPSQSMPDMRREQAGKELESDPRGTSLGEVLSCRIFDPGKGATKPEILVDSMRSTAGAWKLGPAGRRADRCQFGESLQ